MNELHAEKRTDKRGNLVTRWVRSFRKSASAASIPAPAMSGRKHHMADEIEELCNMVRPPEIAPWSDDLYDNVSFVAESDPDLLRRISKVCQFSSQENEHWRNNLQLGKPFRKQSREGQLSVLSEMRASLVVVPLLERISSQGGDAGAAGSPDRYFFENIVRDYMSSGRIVEPPDSLVAAVVMTAYLRGIHDPKEWEKGRTAFLDYDSSKDNVDYIAARVEAVEAILPELRERKTSDPEVIEMLLHAPSPSLHEGML